MEKRKLLIFAMTAALLCGCQQAPQSDPAVTAPTQQTAPPTVPDTTPAAAVPPDGDPSDVTCLGSYTAPVNVGTIIARCGDEKLTNGQLQGWYWASVAQYMQSSPAAAPDLSQPLDIQPCTIDPSVNSWQQYFLRKALSRWHTAQALAQQAAVTPIVTEPDYQPDESEHLAYLSGKPAAEFLYGQYKTYHVNSQHQAWLDSLPEQLNTLAAELGYADSSALAESMGFRRKNLENMTQEYNYAYTYLTYLTYDLAVTAQEEEAWAVQQGIEQSGEDTADLRQVLLAPGQEDQARQLLTQWQQSKAPTLSNFAALAHKESLDTGTAPGGGKYRNVRREQLDAVIGDWCFDPARQPGDTTILTTDQGVHILYFVQRTPEWRVQARQAVLREKAQAILDAARQAYPMDIDYSQIALSDAQAAISFDRLLYPDIAHQRYPEVPLYIQDDYTTRYNGQYLSVTGCGINAFAMLASYMTDEEWTPPEMASLYAKYGSAAGTDGMIFIYEPQNHDIFLRMRSYKPDEVREALESGCTAVSLQTKGGVWTNTGHYILLEKMLDADHVQVRDSAMINYFRISGHAEDRHTWKSVTNSSISYWVFDPKVVNVGACTRCGSPDSATRLTSEYLCEKCEKASLRRDIYLMDY